MLSVWNVLWNPPPVEWLLLTGFTTLISSYTIRIPGSVVKLSVSEPLVFLSSLLFGPSAGTVTASIDAVVLSLRLRPQLRTPHRVAFNVGALALSVWPSSLLYFWLTGLEQNSPRYGELETFVLPVYAFAASVFFLNTGLVAVAVAIEKGTSAFAVWRSQFATFAASYLASGAIAAILVVLITAGDAALLALLLPLVIVSVLAVRATLARLNDEHHHLVELNRLHLSTIETLAMAIDAKDQVTHGHIRRVQRFAVELAHRLGVNDESQLRAIEAAALLHDMGKLAIPEFILNKPGKLTQGEFEVMKTHAAIGADLLSSIHFPYPVVPIVRHHHENWDGSGYPDGLRGADIPVGARILSVVDCFDALTSHRPYRQALSTPNALEILTQRRGRMYDPLVVDVFIREHASLLAAAEPPDLPDSILAATTESPAAGATVEHYARPEAAPVEALRALAVLSPFPVGPSLAVWCRQFVDSLHAIAPFDAAALFVPDETSSDLVAAWTEPTPGLTSGVARIPAAERLTGWVAAHRTAVWNSEAALDLGGASATLGLTLGSSIPICTNDTLVAVLTLYGKEGSAISVEQRRAIESLIPAVSDSLLPALERTGYGLDCRATQVRQAAIAAIDVMLSHDRASAAQIRCAVVALTLSPVSDSGSQPEALGGAELCKALTGPGRFLLRITDCHYFACAIDGVTAESLATLAGLAMKRKPLLRYELTTLAVQSPLELQDALRRMLDGPSQQRSGVRVH